MPTIEEAQRQARQTLDTLQTAQETHGASIATNQRALEDLQSALQVVQEAQVDQKRTQSERATSGGHDRSLRWYTAATDNDIKRNARSYLANDGGHVRMRGHKTNGGKGWRWGVLDDPNPRTDWQREAQEVVTTRSIVRLLLQGEQNPQTGVRTVQTPLCDELVESVMADAPQMFSRIFNQTAGTGSEWRAQNLMPELEREVEHQVGFYSMFAERNMGPDGTMILPYREGVLRPSLGAVPSSNDPGNYELSDLSTEQSIVTAYKLAVATQVDRDSSEDAIVAVVPEIVSDISRGIAYGRDDIAINGDSAAAHQDAIASWNTRGLWGSSDFGSLDHRKAAIGLRARAFNLTSMTTDQNAAQTAAGLRTALKKLGAEYFSNPAGIVIAVSPEYWLGTMLGWDEFQLHSSVGDAAAARTGLLGGRRGTRPGSVGFVWGNIEVVLTPFITADLHTTGLYTGASATTGMLVFAPGDFERRVRLGMLIESETNIRNDTVTWVSKVRETFRCKQNDDVSEKKNVHWSFNLTA